MMYRWVIGGMVTRLTANQVFGSSILSSPSTCKVTGKVPDWAHIPEYVGSSPTFATNLKMQIMDKENKKVVMRSLVESNMRKLINTVNRMKIEQHQIVEIIESREQFILVYYG